MTFSLAHGLFLGFCAAGLAQTPPPKLQDYQQKALERALRDAKLRAEFSVPPGVTVNAPGKQVCSVPLVNVLPRARTAPMPKVPLRDNFHMREVPLPAPPCDEPAK